MIKNILIWVWCFPQNFCGLVFKLLTNAKKNGNFYNYNKNWGSITLGQYIFLCPSHWNDKETQMHETGHTIQSLYLGWLYLLVIGIPSLIWAGCFGKYRRKHNISYYDFYTEKWANKLAGIERR